VNQDGDPDFLLAAEIFRKSGKPDDNGAFTSVLYLYLGCGGDGFRRVGSWPGGRTLTVIRFGASLGLDP